MDSALKAQFARSFSGRLYVRIDGWDAPLCPGQAKAWDATTRLLAKMHDGWLTAGGHEEAAALQFDFDSMTDDRLHYHISLVGAGAPQKLGISRNGYLGFYRVAEVTDYWKIEPLRMTAQGLVCNLRDHQGQRAAVAADTRLGGSGEIPRDGSQDEAFMNVSHGETFEFLLKVIS